MEAKHKDDEGTGEWKQYNYGEFQPLGVCRNVQGVCEVQYHALGFSAGTNISIIKDKLYLDYKVKLVIPL